MRDSEGGTCRAKGKLQLGFWLLQMQQQHQGNSNSSSNNSSNTGPGNVVGPFGWCILWPAGP